MTDAIIAMQLRIAKMEVCRCAAQTALSVMHNVNSRLHPQKDLLIGQADLEDALRKEQALKEELAAAEVAKVLLVDSILASVVACVAQICSYRQQGAFPLEWRCMIAWNPSLLHVQCRLGMNSSCSRSRAVKLPWSPQMLSMTSTAA